MENRYRTHEAADAADADRKPESAEGLDNGDWLTARTDLSALSMPEQSFENEYRNEWDARDAPRWARGATRSIGRDGIRWGALSAAAQVSRGAEEIVAHAADRTLSTIDVVEDQGDAHASFDGDHRQIRLSPSREEGIGYADRQVLVHEYYHMIESGYGLSDGPATGDVMNRYVRKERILRAVGYREGVYDEPPVGYEGMNEAVLDGRSFDRHGWDLFVTAADTGHDPTEDLGAFVDARDVPEGPRQEAVEGYFQAVTSTWAEMHAVAGREGPEAIEGYLPKPMADPIGRIYPTTSVREYGAAFHETFQATGVPGQPAYWFRHTPDLARSYAETFGFSESMRHVANYLHGQYPDDSPWDDRPFDVDGGYDEELIDAWQAKVSTLSRLRAVGASNDTFVGPEEVSDEAVAGDDPIPVFGDDG